MRFWIWAVMLAASLQMTACSGDGARGLRVGTTGPRGGAAGSAHIDDVDNPSGAGTGGLDAGMSGSGDDGRHAPLSLEVTTLRCVDECAEVQAIARGGHPPYTFAWDDGTQGAVRTLCASDATSFGIAVTDTAIEAEELSYEARTTRADVAADGLGCAGDASVPDEASPCGPEATGPVLLVARRESATSGAYTPQNGSQNDYVAYTPLVIVASAHHAIHLGTCRELLLAADVAGTRAPGWDDTLVIEYSAQGSASVDKRWFYGVVSPITYAPTGEELTSIAPATVSGWDLDPAVPNPFPFGYPPLAIDLMEQAPSPAAQFELTIHVLDSGGFGSTTDLWAIPR